ncbi:MAG: hypothetical protein NZ901_00955 [Geminocystis sp.]|nr:hypothetical protein [Geminocystis sp.]HIK36517.1 hypothetical protein [Geminocystis sp. M7585_C2015_104]MCS7146738.1 hypothetical protein [Geminocystis sp.]MCX8077112.1 hypothetical protein [Geminocystis sp.]MDW8115564.1 hypothetical protein [Geminocystis sp.]
MGRRKAIGLVGGSWNLINTGQYDTRGKRSPLHISDCPVAGWKGKRWVVHQVGRQYICHGKGRRLPAPGGNVDRACFYTVECVSVVWCYRTKREQEKRSNGKDKRELFEIEGGVSVSGNSKEGECLCPG